MKAKPVTISLLTYVLSLFLLIAGRPFLGYLFVFIASILPAKDIFTEDGVSHSPSSNAVFSILYVIFLASAAGIIYKDCYLYFHLILTGFYVNVLIAAYLHLPQLQGRKILLTIAALLNSLFG
ncbi:MAG: hypothetical protein II126_04800 [Erysipelotrichaceae bacterium]|nr:hypothetical protein [Erysipelotrichaceae bacterium]